MESLTNNSDIKKIKEASVYLAKNTGINANEFLYVIECESSYQPNAVGDSGYSVGILQFKRSTFNQYCEGDYYSIKAQLTCAAKMWQGGLQRHWTCFKKMPKDLK